MSIFLLFLMQGALTSGAVEVKPSTNPIRVGDTLVLAVSPTAKINSGSWSTGAAVIVTWVGPQQSVFPNHIGRASVDSTTGALTLRSVTLADTGVYTVQGTDPVLTASATITALEGISNVNLTTNVTIFVEFRDSVVLACLANGPSPAFLWMNGSSVVTAGNRVQIGAGGSTLTILNVTRYDRGPFTCNVSNAVSTEISQSPNLTIYYGPDHMELRGNGQNISDFLLGSNLNISCSAKSHPTAQFQWAFQGDVLNTTGPDMMLYSISEKHSGLYSCLAYNNVTQMYSNITKHINIDHICGETIIASQTQLPVGSNVTLRLSNQTKINFGTWNFKGGNIVLIAGDAQIIYPAWKDRVTFNRTTSALSISSLQVADSGIYSLSAGQPNFKADVKLLVQVPVTMAKVNANGVQPILNKNFNLTCDTVGFVETIYWIKNGSALQTTSQIMLDKHNTTVTFSPVLLSDNGYYECKASNLVSSLTSGRQALHVAYGPYTPVITGPEVMASGENITLFCSADSYPPSSFHWMFHSSVSGNTSLGNASHTSLGNTSTLALGPLTLNMTGMYTCFAHNNVTNQNNSTKTMLKVVAPVTMAKVNANGVQPILNKNFNLTCDTVGFVETIYWIKNGSALQTTSQIMLDKHNTTVTFSPVLLSDNGYYECKASSLVSSLTSGRQALHVAYGPYTPVITGPEVVESGESITLSCSADSYPPSSFHWMFHSSVSGNTSLGNASHTSLGNTSTLALGPLTLNMTGMYTCFAHNNVTNQNNSTKTMLKVVDSIKYVHVEGPSTAAIQGLPFTLRCNVTGVADHVYWMKDKRMLQTDNTTTVHNYTLAFNPVRTEDNGYYQCTGANTLTNMTSPPYALHVSFGPYTPNITGPLIAETGQDVVFNCSASSYPPSSYHWYFNGTNKGNSPMLEIFHLSLNMSGEYTCMAINNVTKKNSTSSTSLKVIKGIKSVVIKEGSLPIQSHNFTLSCEVAGPYDSMYWMKDGVRLSSSNASTHDLHMSYYMQNNSLHFSPVTTNDNGVYKCAAINLIRTYSSPEYKLLVNCE
ncbi:Carcinoembryonic antigen-related cell adhesion molecule 5 [Merluccius polli]|uniref:Carcinoembryonic antigen-related cell adhesion molecule 5 n=1 Tax=Merluccius polli TaxID=89951 RepID=A0AA47NV59_MERPO|nr:Carcinoembryonic antigen-related cell adhesion molecule 5 [Merluccius polli]